MANHPSRKMCTSTCLVCISKRVAEKLGDDEDVFSTLPGDENCLRWPGISSRPSRKARDVADESLPVRRRRQEEAAEEERLGHPRRRPHRLATAAPSTLRRPRVARVLLRRAAEGEMYETYKKFGGAASRRGSSTDSSSSFIIR